MNTKNNNAFKIGEQNVILNDLNFKTCLSTITQPLIPLFITTLICQKIGG